MRKIIRMTEEDLHGMIMESLRRVLNETDCAGVEGGGGFDMNQPGGSTTTFSSGNYQYDVPFWKVQRRKSKKGDKDLGIMDSETNIDTQPPMSRPIGKIAVNRKK